MSAVQLLRRLLDDSGGAAETGFLLVLGGEGLEDLPPEMSTPQGVYGVHRVETELGLRHLLWKARGAPLIAVMEEKLALRLQKAPDLLRRARNQRVHSLSVSDVLEVILGVRVVGAESTYLEQLALEHLGSLGRALSRRTLPTVVDRKLLRELLLDETVGEEVRTRTAAQLLAQWVREPPEWKEIVSRLVHESLPSLHFDEGALLAWALEEPEKRLRELVIRGALLTVEADELPKPVWGPLWRAAAEGPAAMPRPNLRRAVCRLAEDTLAELGDAARPLLDEADRIGRETLTPSQLDASPVLPLAFKSRCHKLAHRAAEGEVVEADEIAWLVRHRAANLYPADLAVLKSVARLSRYLGEPGSEASDVLDQVSSYLRQGAFADVASIELRRSLAGSEHYHSEAGKVLAAYRERRDSDNRRFAETLASGYESALHRAGLVPLHRVWKREVKNRLWDTELDARIYLVVLDGCSYPVFLEILFALAQDSAFPVGIAPHQDGHVAGLPALSPLPTVTSHSRGALFLGELPSDPLVSETVFRDQQEAKTDKARFQQNDALGSRSRKLFLKGDLTDGGQALYQELKNDVTAVVAAVFNAVDDQIESVNTGVNVRIEPESIQAFKPSLRVALEAGRRVLVTADHGYSAYVDNSLRRGAGGRRRFLPLDADTEVPDGFLEIDLKGLGGPPERRAFAWQSGAYLGHPKVGFHGGCSLEEMVVPLAWLERDGLHADEPSWWFGRRALPAPPAPVRDLGPVETPVPSDDLEPSPSEPSPPEPSPQMSLFDVATKAHVLPLSSALLARLSSDQKTVLVLLHDNGSARSSELAKRLKKNPMRLNGLMVQLQRLLHAEDLVLFTKEVLPSGETQYVYRPPEGT